MGVFLAIVFVMLSVICVAALIAVFGRNLLRLAVALLAAFIYLGLWGGVLVSHNLEMLIPIGVITAATCVHLPDYLRRLRIG